MNRPERNDGRHVAETPDDLPKSPLGGARCPQATRAAAGEMVRPLRRMGDHVRRAIALLRIFYHDGTHVLAVLNAFTRYVYLPAYPASGVALWKRRWWLAAAKSGDHRLPSVLARTRFHARSPICIAAAGEPTATHDDIAFTAHILRKRSQLIITNITRCCEEIRKPNPDVIVLVEFSSALARRLSQSPLLADVSLRQRMEWLRSMRSAYVSKLPLKSISTTGSPAAALKQSKFRSVPQTLRLIGLHAPRPMDVSGRQRLRRLLEPYDSADPRRAHPLVVVGDFNATQYSLRVQATQSHRTALRP